MLTDNFGLLKINESTGSDKDEEVQRRTTEAYSENLRNTKLCHSSSTRVPASLWNQKRSQFTAKDFEIVNHHFDITGSVH